jgi:hypothetical protein
MPSTAGDWTCPTCNDLQFARNAACRRCFPKGHWTGRCEEKVGFHGTSLGFHGISMNFIGNFMEFHWTFWGFGNLIGNLMGFCEEKEVPWHILRGQIWEIGDISTNH